MYNKCMNIKIGLFIKEKTYTVKWKPNVNINAFLYIFIYTDTPYDVFIYIKSIN